VLPAARFKAPFSDQAEEWHEQPRDKCAAEIYAAIYVLLDLYRDRHRLLPILPGTFYAQSVFSARQRRKRRVLRCPALRPGFAVLNAAVVFDRYVHRLDVLALIIYQ